MADYALNYRNESSVNRQRPNRVPFAAADDATAALVQTAFNAIMSGKNVSLMKYHLRQDFGGVHPRGTNKSVAGIIENDMGLFATKRIRNIADTATNAALAAVFVGHCNVDDTTDPVTAADFPIRTLTRGEGT